MNLLKTICNIKNRYASPFEMADDGIMGMNQRNVNFIGRYNKRNLFPLVDNKLLTKQIAMKNHVKTPVLLGSIQNQHEVSNVLNIIGEHTEWFKVVKLTRALRPPVISSSELPLSVQII